MPTTTAPRIDRITVLVDASRSDFFHPPLETYHPVQYISPRITKDLASQLARRSVIFCVGDAPADLLDLTRHVAWFVTSPKTGLLHTVTSVQEWAAAAAGKQRIHQALLAYEEPTLFILPRLLPKHIDYDFSILLSIAKRRGHAVLATTDMPQIWQRQPSFDMLKQHWHILRTDAIYDAGVLATELVRAIKFAQQRLPRDFVTNVAMTHNIIGTINAAQLAVNLRMPSQIGEFVELLCGASETEAITEELIQRLQLQVTNDDRRLHTWFQNLADTREQLLALAMTLFDGLAEDQFFAVFDTLVERTWGRRAPSLRGVDYADTDSVHQYVRFVKTDQGEVINAQLLNQRSMLIKQAWEQYRRHILSTLPILVQLVRSSIEPETAEPALSGSNERRDNLRTVISNLLGDIGLIDQRVVEESLLQLALDPHVAIQSVAAQAIARWRDSDNIQQMMEFLDRLRHPNVAFGARVRGIVEAQNERYSSYREARHNMLKTVLLTIGYTAQFEQPNCIPKSLFGELEQAASGDDTDVLRFFCAYVMPLLLNKHLTQISRLIPRLARNRRLHKVIAQGLAQVYGSNAEMIDELLLRWYEHTLLIRDRSMSEASFRLRTDLLSCVLTCYGYLPYNIQEHHPVLDRIYQVLHDEEDKFVRKSAINTLFRLLRDGVEPARELLGLLQHKQSNQTNEIELVVDQLVEIGKRQREEQKGGDQFTDDEHKDVSNDRRQVALWIGQVRPPTDIERILLNWMQDRQHIVAQQVAVRVLVTIVAHYRGNEMDRWEAAQRKRRQRRRKLTQALRERIERAIGGLHAFSFYNYLIVPPGVALTSPRHMGIVRNILPELIDIKLYNTFPIAWFYDRLEEIDPGDGDLRTLALRLEQAVRWARFRVFVKILLGIMLFSIISLIVFRYLVQR